MKHVKNHAMLCIVAMGILTSGESVLAATTLSNSRFQSTFSIVPGSGGAPTRLQLDSMQLVGTNEPVIAMASGCGDWRVRVSQKGNAENDTVIFGSDGVVTPATGGQQSATIQFVSSTASSTQISALWNGVVKLANMQGVNDGRQYEMEVTWTLPSNADYVEAKCRFKWLTAPVPVTAHPFVEIISFPEVKVTEFTNADDNLLVPYFTGFVIPNPTDLPFTMFDKQGSTPVKEVFPAFDGARLDQTSVRPMNVGLYWSGTSRRGVFVYGDNANNGVRTFKEIRFATDPTAGNTPGKVNMRIVQYPSNVFDDQAGAEYIQPYSVRVGEQIGDYWNFSERYRAFLDSDVSWYTGPLLTTPDTQSPQKAKAKALIADTFMSNSLPDDTLDRLEQNSLELNRIIGGKVNAVWYNGNWKDTFEQFYREDYLPGRPSFVGATKSAQLKFDNNVLPYFTSTTGIDYTGISGMVPTQKHVDIEAAALRLPDGSKATFAAAPQYSILCQGTNEYGVQASYGSISCSAALPAWKSAIMLDQATRIVQTTDCNGMYLDYYQLFPCWSEAHAHSAGGGDYVYEGRVSEVQSIRAIKPTMILTIEGALEPMTADIDLMHQDPIGTSLPWTDASPCASCPSPPVIESHQACQGLCTPTNLGPCTWAVPLTDAYSVPLFKSVFDNVKMARIGGGGVVYDLIGQRAWVDALAVLGYGQIITPDVIDTANFDYSDLRIEAPRYQFIRRLASALRDQGLGAWHNGTLRRLPNLTITETVPGSVPAYLASSIPTSSYDGIADCPEYPRSPTYQDGNLAVGGMYQLPPGLTPANSVDDLCLVVANPWVGDSNGVGTTELSVGFTIDRSSYVGWDSTTSFTLYYYRNGTFQSTVSASFTNGTYTAATETLKPGEIGWWILHNP